MRDYKYGENFFNLQDNYQSFAIIFGVGIAISLGAGALIYRIYKSCCSFALREKSRYTFIEKISPAIRGKNLHATLVFSKSLRDVNKKNKIWFYKPIFFVSTGYSYNLESATKEVYFGTLITELLGKQYAAETKFNLYDAGVVSRVHGDDPIHVVDLFNFCAQQKTFLPEVQQQFLQVIILGIILGNRDMRLENLVVKLDADGIPNFVYAIDYEFGGSGPKQDFISLTDALNKIAINPKQLIHLLMDKTFKWNYAVNSRNFKSSVFNLYSAMLLGSITAQECLETMSVVCERLAADDFKICSNVKQKILDKLKGHEYAYPCTDINKTIIPTIDRAIEEVVGNVKTTKMFLESRHARLDFHC